MIWRIKPLTVCAVLVPYGSRAVSPKYSMSSWGNELRSSRTTVNPPNPLSKTTMGDSGDIRNPFRSEPQPRRIAKVQYVFLGQRVAQLAHDRQPAQPAIQNNNGRLRRHQESI